MSGQPVNRHRYSFDTIKVKLNAEKALNCKILYQISLYERLITACFKLPYKLFTITKIEQLGTFHNNVTQEGPFNH